MKMEEYILIQILQIIKTLDSFLDNSFFIGLESKNIINYGIIGAEANHKLIGEILKFYDKRI